MKKYLAGLGLLTLASLAQAQVTTILDSFSGDLGNWSTTELLNFGTATFNTSALGISDGALTFVTDTFDGTEQAAHIFGNNSLAVGEELQVDVSATVTGNQDIGLYVGIVPTQVTTVAGAGSRASYVSIYKRSNGQVFSRGFSGTTEHPLVGGNVISSATTFFVARTTDSTFEVGYYDLVNERTIMTTREDATNTAAAIGLYTDVRGVGTIGSVDNFRIFNATAIPEPSSFAALAGAMALGFVASRRRRA